MKRFKKRFDYSRLGIVWEGIIPHLVRLHYIGTVSTYRWGWKKKPKRPDAEQITEPTLAGEGK